MKILVAATAFAIAAAGLTFAPVDRAQAQTQTHVDKQHTVTKKKAKSKTQRHAVRRGSPYSSNPANDAYVNGTYVGSDPDPRIRWQLKREYCEDSADGCGY
jgi:hypothetical protein